MLTDGDRIRLDRLRLQRFRALFPELQDCIVHLDLEHTLHIHCTNAEDAENLLIMAHNLGWQGWIVIGAPKTVLWCEQARLWTGDVQNLTLEERNELESVEDFVCEVLEMTTAAVLEKPADSTPGTPITPTASTATSLPGCSIALIAADVEETIDNVRAWLLSQGAAIIPWQEEEIITGETAISALNHFTPLLVQRRMANRGLIVESPAPIPSPNGSVPTVATAEATPKAAPKPKVVRLPAKYTTLLVKNPRTALEKLLPKETSPRLTYLEAIATETEEGTVWLTRVANAFTTKYRGDAEKNRQNLLEAARKLFSEMRAEA